MRKLAILGASGHGKVIADAALCSNWHEVYFFDDAWPTLKEIDSWAVIGDSESLLLNSSEYDGIVVAIGNNKIRSEKISQFQQVGVSLPTIIHPSAVVSQFAFVADGCVILAGAIINPSAQLSMGCIVNTGASVDHDCILHRAVHISPGAHLAGNVSVGDFSWVGIGASVRQNIVIGNGVCVGAGAAVVNDIPDDCTVVGVPAKRI